MSQSDNFFLSVSEVQQKIISDIKPVAGYERVDLRHALGRILAEDIKAAFNTPPEDNSGMDGYAFRSEDIQSNETLELKLVGQSFAGHPYPGLVESGQAIRIMTGAKVPDGADTVVMQENTSASEHAVLIDPLPALGSNIRRRRLPPA